MKNALHLIGTAAVAITLLIGCPTSAVAQAAQAEIAQGLNSSSRAEMAQAMAQAVRLGPSNLREEVRRAALDALLREGELAAQRREGSIASYPLPEIHSQLAALVAAFNDPRAIRPLAAALGASPLAAHALADFGEPAAQAVLNTVEQEVDGAVLMDGFLALRFLVEKHKSGEQRLSASTVDRIRTLAAEGLQGRYGATTVRKAIDLGLALEDAHLTEMVEAIASDASVIRDRVDTTTAYATRLQEYAAERLSGAPPRLECCIRSPFSH